MTGGEYAVTRLRQLIVVALVLLACMGPSVGAARAQPGGAPPASNGPIVTFTRQNAFTIPFRIDAVQTPGQQPVEVQLHVSTNQAATWELSGRVKPEKGSFVFRAPHDGEYWYSIRTVDAQGGTHPDGPLEPQLKVTVDTVAPRLEVTAFRGDAGEVVARWHAVDPNLKPSSFKLEYQNSATSAWEPVATEQPPEAMRHTLSGEATWWPKGNLDSIIVRAQVTDLSGNPAASQAAVKLGAPPPLVQRAGPPAAEAPRAPASDSARAERGAGNGSPWPVDRSLRDTLQKASDADLRGNGGAASDTAWRSGAARRLPAQTVSQSTRGVRSTLDFSLLPAGARPRMVNARSFELEYEVDSVGPSGIAKVELWGTRDGGRTWSIFGTDTDNKSPMPVGVDGEGIYGFRVVVQSGSGLGGRPPAEGDLPDIWIGVDLTKPVGRITSADIDAESSELVIRWEADDDLPDPRPISLSFSGNTQGSWTPIAAGLENTGGYRWRLESRVPDKIFLRLEVRDEAGNVGTFDTAEPISLDRHRPEGRIRGVRPLGQ